MARLVPLSTAARQQAAKPSYLSPEGERAMSAMGRKLPLRNLSTQGFRGFGPNAIGSANRPFQAAASAAARSSRIAASLTKNSSR
jgi:hypothetical protein